MRYIRQCEEWDCGIAALAMATAYSYERIANDLRAAASKRKGLNEDYLQNWPANNGFAWNLFRSYEPTEQRYTRRELWPLSPFAPSHIVQVDATRGPHFIAMDYMGEVFDPWSPARKTLSHADYKQIYWMMGIYKVG